MVTSAPSCAATSPDSYPPGPPPTITTRAGGEAMALIVCSRQGSQRGTSAGPPAERANHRPVDRLRTTRPGRLEVERRSAVLGQAPAGGLAAEHHEPRHGRDPRQAAVGQPSGTPTTRARGHRRHRRLRRDSLAPARPTASRSVERPVATQAGDVDPVRARLGQTALSPRAADAARSRTRSTRRTPSTVPPAPAGRRPRSAGDGGPARGPSPDAGQDRGRRPLADQHRPTLGRAGARRPGPWRPACGRPGRSRPRAPAEYCVDEARWPHLLQYPRGQLRPRPGSRSP